MIKNNDNNMLKDNIMIKNNDNMLKDDNIKDDNMTKNNDNIISIFEKMTLDNGHRILENDLYKIKKQESLIKKNNCDTKTMQLRLLFESLCFIENKKNISVEDLDMSKHLRQLYCSNKKILHKIENTKYPNFVGCIVNLKEISEHFKKCNKSSKK